MLKSKFIHTPSESKIKALEQKVVVFKLCKKYCIFIGIPGIYILI